MRRTLTLTVSALAVVFGVAACTAAPTSAESTVTVSDETILIDVRTADEHAGGHLEDARLLDFNNGDLAAAIPSLDPDAEYLIYCRSGNRAGQAIALMEEAGFSNLTNLGSLEEASEATGLPIMG